MGHELCSNLTNIVHEELAQLTAERRVHEGSSLTGKSPPSPPKYNGCKGIGKLSVEVWLMQFLDWCTLHSVPASRRIFHAIQALEGDAVQNIVTLSELCSLTVRFQIAGMYSGLA